MKKFRMMLPLVAFVFAMVGAVAGDLLPGVNAYYKPTASCSLSTLTTEQNNCQPNQASTRPICTVNDNGIHRQAFEDVSCQNILRVAP